MAENKKRLHYKHSSKGKSQNATNKSFKVAGQLTSAVRKDWISFLLSLLLFVIVIVITIASAGYLFTAGSDYSIVKSSSFSTVMGNGTSALNPLGLRGAFIADGLIDCFLGVGSFVLLFYAGYLSLKLMKVVKKGNAWHLFIVAALSAIWISLFASSISLLFDASQMTFRIGGLHGDWLRDALMLNIGIVGVVFFLLFGAVSIVVIYDPRSVVWFRKVFSLGRRKEKQDPSIPEEPQHEDSSTGALESIREQLTTDKQEEAAEEESFTPGDEVPVKSIFRWKRKAKSVEKKETTEEDAQPKSNTVEDAQPDRPIQVASPTTSPNTTESRLVVEQAKGDPLSAAVESQIPKAASESSGYEFPSLDLLDQVDAVEEGPDMEDIKAKEQKIIETLESFKIRAVPIKATVGPTVTLYEIQPDAGVKISRIRNLEDDIALNLKSVGGIRIIAPIPGKGTIGIEVPNKKSQIVRIHSLLASRKYNESTMSLPVAMGRTITNDVFMFDLTKTPHLLLAGATGQGKSVGLNVLITSLLYCKEPSQLKFIMIDPKMLEFSIYKPIERLFFASLPDKESAIIVEMERVVPVLLSLCQEMDARYELLSEAKVRNIKEYNRMYQSGRLPRLTEKGEENRQLPYIVLIVDEFADLIMQLGKEVEKPITRIAQKARAAGIHMVLATQRPSTDVITGTIKANFPSRIAFRVFSQIDSRTILDTTGANQLVGSGDMLFYQGKEMQRLQCAFIDTPETKRIVDFVGAQQFPFTPYELPDAEQTSSDGTLRADASSGPLDPLFRQVAEMIVEKQRASTSDVQRNFEVGFNRAGRIMDQLERAGIVSEQKGSRPRDVLVPDLYALNKMLSE